MWRWRSALQRSALNLLTCKNYLTRFSSTVLKSPLRPLKSKFDEIPKYPCYKTLEHHARSLAEKLCGEALRKSSLCREALRRSPAGKPCVRSPSGKPCGEAMWRSSAEKLCEGHLRFVLLFSGSFIHNCF